MNQLPNVFLTDNDSHEVDADETSSLMSGPGDIVPNVNTKNDLTVHSHKADIRGLAMLPKLEFWQLWMLLGILTGVGLMTIK